VLDISIEMHLLINTSFMPNNLLASPVTAVWLHFCITFHSTGRKTLMSAAVGELTVQHICWLELRGIC